jgi:hypothetical protein
MRCLRVLLVVFCFIDPLQPAAAQLSCSDVTPIVGSIGYQRRLNADRCEGFYQQQVSGSLEFLSLVKGTINYDLASDRTLIVTTPNLSQFVGSQVFLTARALRPGTYYRMDAAVASGGTFRWPINAVLAPANLPSNAIGVVAWINRDLGKYYVPVSVIPENVATPASRPPVMILRSSLDIELLKWRSRQESGQNKIRDWITVGGPQPTIIRAGQPISLDLSGQPSGSLVVEIAVKYANQGKLETEPFRIIVP